MVAFNGSPSGNGQKPPTGTPRPNAVAACTATARIRKGIGQRAKIWTFALLMTRWWLILTAKR